jgi:isoquinoline 1-oxidoreductase beta subunit
MSAPPGSLTRRDFLSATAGGGLVLALTLPGCGRSTAPVGAAGGGAGGQLNAWLKIAGDNTISVIVDRSEMGQGVYTALPMLLAEELEVGLGRIRIVAAPVGDAYVSPGNGGQITGTSNSVQESWDKLRTAGAQAREVLIAAAAARWAVAADDCRAADGVVTGPQGRSATYGELAEAAAKLPLPKSVKLKPRGEFKLIGKGLRRTDTPSKVDGSAVYGIDVQLPGMLYAALAQPPALGGKLRTLDSAAAERLPGVRKVLTTDSGVVVVADHYWQALKGREALSLSWEAGPNAKLDNAAIKRTLAKALHNGSATPAFVAGTDTPAALKTAHRTLSAEYALPLLAHATMEPINCTADVTAQGCNLYVGTQVQALAQAAAATAAGLQPAQVQVFTTLLGCGFGRHLEVDYIPPAVAASKALGRPVKLIWTREDDLAHDLYRPPAALRASGGLDAKGNLVAFGLHIASPSINLRSGPLPPEKTYDDSIVEDGVFAYETPSAAVTYVVQEVGVDVGNLRSVTHAINTFAIETFMDELAAAAGRNPLEFRTALFPNKPRHRAVLEAVARRAAWGAAPPGRHQGIAFMEGYKTMIAMVAEISVERGEPQVHKIFCAVDCGQMVNPKIVESQIQSGIVFGLGAALWQEITLAGGRVQQQNFDGYRVLRHHELPELDVQLIDSDAECGGIGEPAVAVVAPAVCNALRAATGRSIRTLPIFGRRPAPV